MTQKILQPGKTSSSSILWFQQAENADRVIQKGLMWHFEVRATEMFRSRFRALQCFNCQRYGHIDKICTAFAKYGICAGGHNTRDCTGKPEFRCGNCSKNHAAWHQSCPVRLAAKKKPAINRTQDPGRYKQPETRHTEIEDGWQVVGSRKRRAGTAGPQIIGADGEVISRRRPGRPRKTAEEPGHSCWPR